MSVLEMRIVGMIHRRQILERDEPLDFKAALSEIRRLGGWGTSDLCFILNVARGTLWRWECCGSPPNYEDGRAIAKLLTRLRNQSL